MMMTTMIEMLFCFRFYRLVLVYVFVNETNDIVDLANCDGATDGRTNISYRDAEAHLKIKSLRTGL